MVDIEEEENNEESTESSESGTASSTSDVTIPLLLPTLSVVVVVVVVVSDVLLAVPDSDDSVDSSLFPSSSMSTINKDGNCLVRFPSLTVNGEPAIHTKSIQYRSTPLSGKLWPKCVKHTDSIRPSSCKITFSLIISSGRKLG